MTSVENYVQRVETAAKLAADAADNEHTEDEAQELLRQVAELLPTTEDVARTANGKDITHVDNAWLHRLIEEFKKADAEEHLSQLNEIANRLEALHLRLSEAASANATKATPERLQQILARSEYQPDEKKDSVMQGWVRKIQQKIRELLAKLFFKNPSAAGPSPGSMQALRWVIILALVASLAWATILLLQRFQLRQAKLKNEDDDAEAREILGEQFDADVTADDLLKTAAEMARKGEYRSAIRRAYLALLYELEQRGKLRLHRAKTNRDYLSELQHEPQTHLPVSVLTNNYERVWYGHTAATMDDYSGFIEKYREAAR